jgi:hypothetical protein
VARPAAEQLSAAALALDASLGTLDDAVSQISDDVERATYANALGDLFALVNQRLVPPVVREYPDLDEED